jgi:hypothetical protein
VHIAQRCLRGFAEAAATTISIRITESQPPDDIEQKLSLAVPPLLLLLLLFLILIFRFLLTDQDQDQEEEQECLVAANVVSSRSLLLRHHHDTS